ncbi:DUF5946 family protein [Sphingomonas morindae]|uniref:DUF5946 family protein n=1 Tax=Sphingomonas morindae TaxID=1541170 RepID=A0ABY4X6Y7_9SPHN|nr:DUF5946 family protein [Sphingomonas morindae]
MRGPASIGPACKLTLPAVCGNGHPYCGAWRGCWARLDAPLARAYASPALREVLRLTVDAEAVQPSGTPDLDRSRRSGRIGPRHIRSARGRAHGLARRVIGARTADADGPTWLPPPDRLGDVTLADVARAATIEDHRKAVKRGARSPGSAWTPHAEAVAALADRAPRRLQTVRSIL